MDRQELIQNAVAFLADPKTQGSTIAQRIQFLEAKGLTSPEIDLAIRQANSTNSANYRQPYATQTFLPPLQHQWDWRDYFITAIVTGSVAYGAAALFRKYISPHLQPPNATAYEEDRDALTAQFDAAEALLKEIQAETQAIRTAVDEQKEKIDKTTEDVDAVVAEMRQSEIKQRDEVREIREEVNNIRDMLPKMIEKNKDAQTQSLAELQQELKSLKALLLSRGTISQAPSSPLPLLGRPTIPAWQLASSTPSTTEQTTSGIEAPAVGNGKGKEVDYGPSSST